MRSMVALSKIMLAVFVLVLPAIASAQPARTFVSSTGTDTNSCSIAAPCRTLQRGIDAVAAGGDVLIVDAGGFGSSVNISKSVSVFAPPGGQSRLAVLSGETGIRINEPDIDVSIDNLGITGGINVSAVSFGRGRTLSISNMDIFVRGGTGIGQGAFGEHLYVSDTTIRNGSNCILAQGTSSSPVRATIRNTRALGCAVGYLASEHSSISIVNSVAATAKANCLYGFVAGGPFAKMAVDSSTASGCGIGVFSNGDAMLSVSNSQISGNMRAGWASGDGIGRTYGNNRIFGNGNNTLTGFTPIAEQ